MKIDSTNPEWLKKERKGWKQGAHEIINLSCGDTYLGHWKDDKKDGLGIYHCPRTGYVYEGEFKFDERNGYGVLSCPIDDNYPMKAKNSKGSAKTKQLSPSKLKKIYVGEWECNQRNGAGTAYYSEKSVYQGQWKDNLREGWGKMMYPDNSIYEGEWHADKRHGQGILIHQWGDRYEGTWMNDLKEGPGKFIYLKKRQLYEGEWHQGVPKCGSLMQFPHSQPSHPFPKIELVDYKNVLDCAKDEIKNKREGKLLEV